ncbi:Lipid kinase YegS [compost metagenome]
MAKELGIPADTHKALDIVMHSEPQKIHVIRINGEVCIHLSDIGFNAYLVKKFDELPERGMKTYVKAAWQAFWNRRRMEVRFRIGNQHIHAKAAMVVLANATKYGTGLQINPNGRLNDHLFEVILIKSYAILEILKIWMSRLPWNPKKIECYQVDTLTIRTRYKVHFQVDGEYLGKTNRVEAQLLPASLSLLIPSTSGVPVP